MKIGVIADTHIPVNTAGLPAKLTAIFKGVDIIIHAGDLVDERVVTELQSICPRVEVVAGNMDLAPSLAGLPKKKTLQVGKITIGVVHGWGGPQDVPHTVRKEFKHADVIVFGHSHQPFNKLRGGVLLFNPGSATDTVFAPYQSVGILTIDGDQVHGEIIRL